MAQNDNEPPRLRPPPPVSTEPPEHVKKPQIYEIFHSPKEGGDGNGNNNNNRRSEIQERAKAAAASTIPVAEDGQPVPRTTSTEVPKFSEAVKSIKAEEFLKIHKIPCAREGFMTGIGAGALVGGVRYIAGGRMPRAANWAFGTFLLGSIVQWEYCQRQRRKEHAAVARVVEVMNQKQAGKQAQAQEAARLKREAEERDRPAEGKSWYKFW